MTVEIAANRDNYWNANQLAFQAWLALPKTAREPKSQQAFAKTIDVTESTLSHWKHLPGWGDAVADLAIDLVKNELAPILYAQAAAAKKGSLPHAQWIFELAGRWSPARRVEVSGPGGEAIPIREVLVRMAEDVADPDQAALDSPA